MNMTFLDPGQFTARLDLEAATPTPDGQGGAALAWTVAASLWARIEPTSFTFTETAGQMRGQLTHRIWIRARQDVAEGMRFRKGARVFTIRAVRDPDETGRYLVCLCEEGAL
ncbi:phage head closure protein [Rhizobium sp. C1]|uniref:phage head closure protein n=1 Tax=Rhizobium sp. C1 TaxID=1349799 RepID=UPI001E3779DC|nr:phage head closure protein [Rhizobium sp. C1]MCD2177486.1 phage head closure protein [Rhizobium sp. C1]